jgi:hypothetical protein
LAGILAGIWREWQENGENLARLAGFPCYLAGIWPERGRNHFRDNGAISLILATKLF